MPEKTVNKKTLVIYYLEKDQILYKNLLRMKLFKDKVILWIKLNHFKRINLSTKLTKNTKISAFIELNTNNHCGINLCLARTKSMKHG